VPVPFNVDDMEVLSRNWTVMVPVTLDDLSAGKNPIRIVQVAATSLFAGGVASQALSSWLFSILNKGEGFAPLLSLMEMATIGLPALTAILHVLRLIVPYSSGSERHGHTRLYR